MRHFPVIPSEYLAANPSALHREGVALKQILDSARTLVANTIGAHSDEVIFTSGATESDTLALVGVIRQYSIDGVDPSRIVVYTSPFEHVAVSESINHGVSGVCIKKLQQENGYVDVASIVVPENTEVVIVSVMYVQNEIGTVQPIKEIARRIRKLRKEYPKTTILFHTDATQAPLFYDLHVARLGIDMMTLGATKLYCNKGVGMLYKKRGVAITPVLFGGGQESGLRPGTQPVELIHTFAHALSYAQAQYEHAYTHTRTLQQYFESTLTNTLPSVGITALENETVNERVPHITHLVVPDIDSELLVLELDARGVAVSSKSACKNEDTDESTIVKLLYPDQNLGAIRISYGRTTTKKDIKKCIEALKQVLQKYTNI